MSIDDFQKYTQLCFSDEQQKYINIAIENFKIFLQEHKSPICDDKTYTIYKICSKDKSKTECYIGSTSKSLTERMYHHKKTCDNQKYRYYDKLLYQYVRSHGGMDLFEIVQLDKMTTSRKNALIREQYYINLENSSLNKIKSFLQKPSIR